MLMKSNMSKIGGFTIKFEIKKFNEKETSVYDKRVWRYCVQQGLHKTLQGKSSKSTGKSDKDWKEMDLKAASTIYLCLADEVIYDVMDEETAIGLWSRLETLYMTKSLSNKLYLMK